MGGGGGGGGEVAAAVMQGRRCSRHHRQIHLRLRHERQRQHVRRLRQVGSPAGGAAPGTLLSQLPRVRWWAGAQHPAARLFLRSTRAPPIVITNFS